MKVTDPGAKRYVYKDPKLKPMTKFEVKVKAFNSQGEGPYSITAIIYSAQDRKYTALTFTKKAMCFKKDFMAYKKKNNEKLTI